MELGDWVCGLLGVGGEGVEEEGGQGNAHGPWADGISVFRISVS
jgi:hypothetical protein